MSVPQEKTFIVLFMKKKKQNKVVFTNGCFDLIHEGHIHLLKKAKSLGDILIVGLNSDRSVRALNKKPQRPINSQETRASILRAIRYVDHVIIFDNFDRLLKRIKPDFLVKGCDWPENKIAGREFVESYGGKVVRVDYIEGKSTTNLLQKIHERFQQEI